MASRLIGSGSSSGSRLHGRGVSVISEIHTIPRGVATNSTPTIPSSGLRRQDATLSPRVSVGTGVESNRLVSGCFGNVGPHDLEPLNNVLHVVSSVSSNRDGIVQTLATILPGFELRAAVGAAGVVHSPIAFRHSAKLCRVRGRTTPRDLRSSWQGAPSPHGHRRRVPCANTLLNILPHTNTRPFCAWRFTPARHPSPHRHGASPNLRRNVRMAVLFEPLGRPETSAREGHHPQVPATSGSSRTTARPTL